MFDMSSVRLFTIVAPSITGSVADAPPNLTLPSSTISVLVNKLIDFSACSAIVFDPFSKIVPSRLFAFNTILDELIATCDPAY